jgi:adenine-specific DNA-methyltransferase
MKATLSGQKLRGGYYTPACIGEFLARWAIMSPSDCVLEPSCGDGNLLFAAASELIRRGADRNSLNTLLYGVEFEPDEASKARKRLHEVGVSNADSCVRTDDFFTACRTEFLEQPLFEIVGKRFQAVIGNPPFIRYQNFPETHRALAFQLMQEAGLHPNRLTNAWVPFLVIASTLLTEDGRLGMVIPAELFQVGYAAEIRAFLSNFFHRITIVSFRRLVFNDIQQEIVLLLCERSKHGSEGVRVVELEDADALASYQIDERASEELKPMDHNSEKWTQYFLSKEEILLLRSLRSDARLTRSGDVLDVDVGIVTGDNNFFILNEKTVADRDLTGYTRRVVTRSNHLEGGIFSNTDWCKNVSNQYPAFLLNAPDADLSELPEQVSNYVRFGEENAINQGYKCRIRKRWYIVPSVWIPEAFMLRQVHGYPKLILNTAEASCTDTIHRVRFRNGANKKAVTAAFLNSVTFAFSEVMGRSYGGGVLTFEPSEAESLPMPLEALESLDLEEIDTKLRQGNIEAVLDITDPLLLGNGLGFDRSEILRMRGIWKKLRDRRIYRRSTPRQSHN